ncbi:MAG TPA: hypothetical protein VHX66_10590 [Solirubrobacteraceae bacterium]|nr:hypothetical protein [Solirubrobacteraceae bacterium]
MGDLDDAIRDHLELKRRRGADPGEVARQEHEALAPVTRSHPIVVVPPSVEPERGRVPAVAEPISASNGDAPHADEELSDATQEFHVEQSEDWLAAEEAERH